MKPRKPLSGRRPLGSGSEAAEVGDRRGDVAASGFLKLGIPLPGHTSPFRAPELFQTAGPTAVKDQAGAGPLSRDEGQARREAAERERASRSPCFSFSAAERKAATNQAYIS